MRFVVYDDESLEPITVLNLPFTNHIMDEKLRECGHRWRVPVPETLGPVRCRSRDELPSMSQMRIVDLEFEPFVRNSRRHGEQRAWFCFTRAADLAMLLNPAWLPGQRGAVDYLLAENDALTRMLMTALIG